MKLIKKLIKEALDKGQSDIYKRIKEKNPSIKITEEQFENIVPEAKKYLLSTVMKWFLNNPNLNYNTVKGMLDEYFNYSEALERENFPPLKSFPNFESFNNKLSSIIYKRKEQASYDVSKGMKGFETIVNDKNVDIRRIFSQEGAWYCAKDTPFCVGIPNSNHFHKETGQNTYYLIRIKEIPFDKEMLDAASGGKAKIHSQFSLPDRRAFAMFDIIIDSDDNIESYTLFDNNTKVTNNFPLSTLNKVISFDFTPYLKKLSYIEPESHISPYNKSQYPRFIDYIMNGGIISSQALTQLFYERYKLDNIKLLDTYLSHNSTEEGIKWIPSILGYDQNILKPQYFSATIPRIGKDAVDLLIKYYPNNKDMASFLYIKHPSELKHYLTSNYFNDSSSLVREIESYIKNKELPFNNFDSFLKTLLNDQSSDYYNNALLALLYKKDDGLDDIYEWIDSKFE